MEEISGISNEITPGTDDAMILQSEVTVQESNESVKVLGQSRHDKGLAFKRSSKIVANKFAF